MKKRGPRTVSEKHVAQRQALGTVIWNARHDLELSHRALADLSGVSPSKFSDIEAGKTDIYLSTIQRIGDALGLTLEEMFRRAAGNGHPPT